MAPQATTRPRKSASYYKSNPESYAKKLAYDSKYGKRPSKIKRRSELNQERRRRGVYGKGGDDMSHTTSGKMVPEDPSTNRARNGHGDNQRLKISKSR
jgi:hypothetical protein